MNIYKQKKNKGFTLIEMIVAVFIFTISLTALMSIASRGLKVANLAQKQVVADYLALEGVEVVRNLRDSAFLSFNNSNNWQNVFNQDNCLNSGDPCEFILGSGISLVPCSSDCRVYYSEADYAYRQGTAAGSNPIYVDSGFTREITFDSTSNPDELNVTVVVAWNGGQDNVSYSENLYLWL